MAILRSSTFSSLRIALQLQLLHICAQGLHHGLPDMKVDDTLLSASLLRAALVDTANGDGKMEVRIQSPYLLCG